MVTSLGAREYMDGLARCYARKVKYGQIVKSHDCFSKEIGLYEVDQVIQGVYSF